MSDIYTTINPETGNFTEEQDFVNSWKWKYPDSVTNKNLDRTDKRSIISRYWLSPETPEDTAFRFHAISQERDKMSRKLQREERNSKELFEALELLTLGNKQNKKEILSSKRKIKKFKKEIASFLSHKEECIIFSLEVLGRKKQNAKCTCGLQSILDQL